MNERIKSLAAQALDEMVPYTWTTLDCNQVNKLLEHFANLIANECADELLQESERLYNLVSEETDQNSADSFVICAKKCESNAIMLKTPFGIKL